MTELNDILYSPKQATVIIYTPIIPGQMVFKQFNTFRMPPPHIANLITFCTTPFHYSILPEQCTKSRYLISYMWNSYACLLDKEWHLWWKCQSHQPLYCNSNITPSSSQRLQNTPYLHPDRTDKYADFPFIKFRRRKRRQWGVNQILQWQFFQ